MSDLPDILVTHTRKAWRRCACDTCGLPIHPGEDVAVTNLRLSGEITTWWEHWECRLELGPAAAECDGYYDVATVAAWLRDQGEASAVAQMTTDAGRARVRAWFKRHSRRQLRAAA